MNSRHGASFELCTCPNGLYGGVMTFQGIKCDSCGKIAIPVSSERLCLSCGKEYQNHSENEFEDCFQKSREIRCEIQKVNKND